MRVVTAALPRTSSMRRMRELGSRSPSTSPAKPSGARASTLKREALRPLGASTDPAAPLPATVLTTPVPTSTLRTLFPALSPPSAKYSSTASPPLAVPLKLHPRGVHRLAAAPTPSSLARAPEPARVTICAAVPGGLPRVRRRTRLLPASHTYTSTLLEAGAAARPAMRPKERLSAGPSPSHPPPAPPLSVTRPPPPPPCEARTPAAQICTPP